MAKYSEKVMGKEIGDASVYAEPHTMTGKKVTAEVKSESGASCMNEMNISVGGISKGNYKPEKTDGIVMRGYGAAIKGIKSRGPMG